MPYSPTTWVNNSAPPISAANLNHIELALRAAYPVYNVLDSAYGAVGNGVADDAAAIQAAITAAQGTGGLVYSPPGYTYMISTTLDITAACMVDFNGSTIKKTATFTAAYGALKLSAAGITVQNLVIDGNRTGGATQGGIWAIPAATNCKLWNVTSSHNAYHGVVMQGVADLYHCTASDNNGVGTGNGFHCSGGGLMRLWGNNYAASNNDTGYFFEGGAGDAAADGCRLEGRAYQNANCGAIIKSSRGFCASFISEQSLNFGLAIGGSGLAVNTTNWTFDYVETNSTGFAIPGHAANAAGTGIEMYGTDHCNFGTVVSKKNLGYGVALATNGTVGCTYNTFHSVTCDQTGAGDGDPGIAVTGGSTNNEFGNCVVIGHTVGIVIGEAGVANNDNMFGTVYLAGNTNGGITVNGGAHNAIENVISRNNASLDLTLSSKGVVSFADAASNLNVIGFLDHEDSGSDMATVPAFLVYSDANAVNNSVLDGFARSSQAGAVDLNGGNSFYLRRPARRTSLSTFDSGETWSSSTNDTTNGEFMEGNGGKKVGPNGTGPTYMVTVRTGLALNLSTMAASEWFRMFVYITNWSDFNNATTAIQFAMMTDATNYFAWNFPAAALKNGGNWLSVRKGGMGSAGTPTWASITRIQYSVFTFAGTSTATFDDLIIAETKWDRTSTIGQNNTPAVITVGTSPFAYQNIDGLPLNVMVSGGTVSAIEYSQDANTWYSQGQTSGIFIVNPNDWTRVTYSVAPSMTKVPTR